MPIAQMTKQRIGRQRRTGRILDKLGKADRACPVMDMRGDPRRERIEIARTERRDDRWIVAYSAFEQLHGQALGKAIVQEIAEQARGAMDIL